MTNQANSPPVARIRTARLTDAEAIRGVHERNGLGSFDISDWRANWEAYPFAAEFSDIPIGWVLEAEDGAVVGTLGNIHMLYEMDGRRLRAAIATAWAVNTPYRGMALHLTTAFFKQKGLDLCLNGSASPTASRVLSGLRIPRIPIPDYSTPCFWAANPRNFANAVLRRRNLTGASILSYPAGLALFIHDAVRGSGRGKLKGTVRRLNAFDDRFDSLCERIGSGGSRLRAVRSRAVLEWRFRSDLAAGRVAVLGAGSGGDLSGYIVLVRRPEQELGMSLYDVADLQAVADDPAVYRDLLISAVQLAREDGVDAVKLLTGTPAKRAPSEALRPHSYQLPLWQLYYRAAHWLRPALVSADAWDFSLFDTY
jgi:hypothetical protein